MAVVLSSDIAKLVLGTTKKKTLHYTMILLLYLISDYLQDQDLEEAVQSFCRTSDFLREEYSWLEKGYRAKRLHDIKLVDLIREYTEVKCTGTLFILYLLFYITVRAYIYRNLLIWFDSDEFH